MSWKKWSRWGNWCDVGAAKTAAPSQPGVYIIRHAPDGKPQPICRAGGEDPDGIIYVGTSDNLHRRLHQFSNASRGSKVGHTGGDTYYEYNYARRFPITDIQIGWETYQKTTQANDAETDILNDYRKFYLDNPPLNIAAKRKY
jgi:hypothetical protein